MGYLGRRIGLSQDQGDSNPSGDNGAVGGGILNLFENGYFERQGGIYNAPGQPPPTGIEASGGVISTYTVGPAVYKAHIFTATGEFDVTAIGSYGAGVEYLLVAGGGGTAEGQDGRSGGSGAGGFLTGSANVSTNPYAIVVGAGGAGGAGDGSNGVNTTGLSATAYGGGGGGHNDPVPVSSGNNGGSGGGGWYVQNGTGGKGVYPGSPYIDAPRQGYDGSPGFNQPEYGGGGGGAGGAGGRRTGGPGAPNVYAYGPTNPVTYAAGGEANNYPGQYRNNAGTAGTGNGGSGFASGGSGVAIIRYQIADLAVSAKASGGAISFFGGKTIHTFTNSGTFANPTALNGGASNPLTCEVVLVGGGGGAASGGGGAGGYITGPQTIASASSFAITIGAGGAGSRGPGNVRGSQGVNTVVAFPGGTETAGWGGGGGGDTNGAAPSGQPSPDGSGGGGSWGDPGGGAPSSKGNAGGAGVPTNTGAHGAGGGGGAGGSGQNGTASAGGAGGIGKQIPATFQNPLSTPGSNGGGLGMPGPTSTNVAGGTSGKFWVAGGGAGQDFAAGQNRGGGGSSGPFAGGGDSSASSNSAPAIGSPGHVNTGGGGGGSYATNYTMRGGNGGSGIVIIAYPT